MKLDKETSGRAEEEGSLLQDRCQDVERIVDIYGDIQYIAEQGQGDTARGSGHQKVYGNIVVWGTRNIFKHLYNADTNMSLWA